MKTKLITITAILTTLVLIPAAMAQEARPEQGMRQRFAGPQAGEQIPPLLRDLTPEQLARVRQFVQNRLEEQQVRLEGRMRQEEGIGRPQQGRAMAPGRFAERGPTPMQPPLRGQGLQRRPFEGRLQGECPHCGRPMASARQPGEGFGPRRLEEPLRGEGPQARRDFRGPGFGPRRFEGDAEGPRGPRPEMRQEPAPQRPQRGRILTEPDSERFGPETEDIRPRSGFRRNAP